MLSKAAQRVMHIDMVLTVIPAVREVILAPRPEPSREDQIDEKDPFFVDQIASQVIQSLCNFLTQSYVDTEDGLSPLIHPRQLKPKYARAFFNVKMPK